MVFKAAEYIKSKIDFTPEIGIILGSGLNGLGEKIENPIIIDYKDIPSFPVSTAPGHKGRLILGSLSGKRVVCMQGRFHYYEGWSTDEIIMPIRVMKLLGVKTLILTNAAGGINLDFNVGDIMIITDHINLTGTNPLIGKNDERFGERFTDMSYTYTPSLVSLAEKTANELGVDIKKGVYLGLTGPSYETPAEIRAFRTLGADTVGMSTVFEVIAAAHCKMNILAFSLVTNMAAGVLDKKLTEEEVLEIGALKGEQMQKIIAKTVERL
ncbi:MAG: purine-nucleoside phosphorylase [Ruminococcaceae bacterium]|jgi:purine-nucleoside phosphorylase|nr:purine-nucleoside phosphorylase [Oscillospiraceae bacterium]